MNMEIDPTCGTTCKNACKSNQFINNFSKNEFLIEEKDMSLNLVSPGVKVREVDLTIGRVDGANDQVGAIAGPFEKGPIDQPILIETEQDLLQTFGKPLSTDGQYGYWLSASNFLSYGGVLRVLRSDEAAGSYLNNANVGVTTTSGVTGVKIKSYENYVDDYQTVSNETLTWKYAAKNPGSWANGLKVCEIDAFCRPNYYIYQSGIWRHATGWLWYNSTNQ